MTQPKADITKRSGPSCLREPATYFTVEVPGGPNVPHDRARSRRARQFVPARASLRAADPARWIGRGWQFGDQRRAVWFSGVPYGPANPRVLSDPSGIGNASSLPPLRSNTPAPVVSSTPTAPTRVVTPPSYPSASQQIISTIAVGPRSKAPPRRRGRPQVSSFTGICRGC